MGTVGLLHVVNINRMVVHVEHDPACVAVSINDSVRGQVRLRREAWNELFGGNHVMCPGDSWGLDPAFINDFAVLVEPIINEIVCAARWLDFPAQYRNQIWRLTYPKPFASMPYARVSPFLTSTLGCAVKVFEVTCPSKS